MKTTFFEQLKKDAREVRLSKGERETMRRAIERAFPPLVKSPIRVTPSPFLFLSPAFVSPLAFVLILALVGGGTAYAAESAVPGDALYSIKVNVNEKITEALATSIETKAAAHAKFAERRLREAEVLAERGALTAKTKEEIEMRLDHHAEEIDIVVAEVGRENPGAAEELSSRLGSLLEAHSVLIERLSEEVGDGESREESKRFAEALRERSKRFARADEGIAVLAIRSEAGDISVQKFAKNPENEMTASVLIDAEDDPIVLRIGARASTTLDEAEVLLNVLQKNLNATTAERVKKQIEKTRDFIKNLGGDDKKGSAKALKDAETLRVFIEAQEQFETRALLPGPDAEEDADEEDEVEEEKDKKPEENEDFLPDLSI